MTKLKNIDPKPQLRQTAVSGSRFVPMLFSTPMVVSLLDKTKTETRRTQGLEKINENPDLFRYDGFDHKDKNHYFERLNICGKELEKYVEIKPKINVGDIIWVRETFKSTYTTDVNGKEQFIYKTESIKVLDMFKSTKWKPSLFMPKSACRLFLEVVSVSVERLKDIDEKSAINEGAKHGRYLGLGQIDGSFREGYFELWDSINGKDSTNLNPFVWVYKFQRINQPHCFR
jgi:hypothetical protein